MNEMKNLVPKLRFPEFTDEWEQRKLIELVSSVETGKSKFDAKEAGPYEILGSTSVIGFDDTYDYEGDFLLTARVGANAGSLYRHSGKVKISDNTVFIKGENLDFVYYLLDKYNLKRLSFGSGQPLVKASQLKTLELMVPTTENEQSKIASLLCKIDNTIALHQRKIDAMREYKKGLLQKMFPKDGETVPEIRFPGFTGEWEQRKLGDVVDVRSGRDYKHLETGDIPVYGTGGYMLSVSEALSYDEDAIGIGRKGTIDNPYILKAPFWTVDTLFYVVPNKDNDLNFLYDIFQRVNWKKKDESTGVPSLSKTIINETDIIIPKKDEQERIGKLFESIDNTIALHQRKLDVMKEYKKGLLQQMFC
ncbi:MAG: restriction endonuclease subunit S [Oscillospiraceae bacterium]|nr:restriction endonuclease subunit S [Oscillospiraceae bacterium]